MRISNLNKLKNVILSPFRTYATSERGNMLVFGLCIFVVMLISSGMAIDFMRHETERTQLQTTIDRAVLAAANHAQVNDPETVVRDYIEKSNANPESIEVSVFDDGATRTVGARGQTKINSMFLNMVGIDQLDAPALGVASDSINELEISLVLDISDSMNKNNRLANMKTAAKNFIDSVINTENKDRVSVSLVPYTGVVNAGEALFSYFNVAQQHSFSYCIDFVDADFNATALTQTQSLTQVQQIDIFSDSGPADTTICPSKPGQEIYPFQNSVDDLKARIDGLVTGPLTGSHHGMRWAAALLDPKMQPVAAGLAEDGIIPGTFANRPVEFGAPRTKKVIVLMTDGRNFWQKRLKSQFYDTQELRDELGVTAAKEVFDSNLNAELTTIQDGKNSVAGRASANDNLLSICNAARDKGIEVFTIGFELDDEDATAAIRACASSDAHAYSVTGGQLNTTFATIATTLTRLRLIE